LRVAAGKGYRTPNVLAENNFLLASNRKINIADNLKQEEAWNCNICFDNGLGKSKMKRKA